MDSSVPQFAHTDLDGDRVKVIGGELGAVIFANSHDGEQVVIAVRFNDLQPLIDTLTAIKSSEN